MKTERSGFRMMQHEQLLQELVHDTYKTRRKLPEPTRCGDCGAVWHRGRWTWSAPPADALRAGRAERSWLRLWTSRRQLAKWIAISTV